MSKTIEEQLSANKSFSKKDRAAVLKRNTTNDSFKSENDGIDHINISINAATELGKMLSPEWISRFVHPVMGPFEHMTGFWTYAKSQSHSDYYRTAKPSSCLAAAKSQSDIVNNIDNFKAIILSGIYYKVTQNDKILNKIKDSNLKFEYYYTKIHSEVVDGKKFTYTVKVAQPHGKWMCDIYEEIRAAIKENRQPIMDRFLDNKNEAVFSRFANKITIDEPDVKSQVAEAPLVETIEPATEATDAA